MSWRDLLSDKESRILPWTGSRTVSCRDRSWRINGKLPREYGWFRFETDGGRDATLLEPADLDPGYEEGHPIAKGFLVGNRLIPDGARVDPDPDHLIDQTREVFLVEDGLEHFARAVAVRTTKGDWVYMRQEFPQGPEQAVIEAYQDRKSSVDDIPGVTPALDLAFRFITREREKAEERERERKRRRIEEERKREAEARFQEALRTVGSAVGRRAIAKHDFNTAARAALAITGAELLDARPSRNRGEMVVQYRFRNRRLECVVERDTFHVVDAGVCLAGHDRLFTLESLPAVIDEALDRGVLHVFRIVNGDPGGDPDDEW